MAKLMTFVMVATIMMFLFTIFPFKSSFDIGFNLLTDLTNFEGGTLWANINQYLGLLVAVGAAGVIIGIFGRGSISESVYAAGLAVYLFIFVNDFINIVSYSNSICSLDSSCGWVTYIVSAVVGTIVVGFAISLFDWARGND